jgi:hypothetical protein
MASVLFTSFGEARAESETLAVTGKRIKIISKSALYGFGGGLVVGLASQVFKKKAKNIFMFGSLGLYAGILLGIYVVTGMEGPTPYEGPDTYDDFSSRREIPFPAVARSEWAVAAPDLQVNFLNLRF